MRSQNNTAFTARTRTGKAITCAVVVAFTAAFYFMYLTAFTFARQILLAVLWWKFQAGTAVVLGLAFDLLALGVLWRYLTPARVFRFWHRGAEELASPHIQAWGRGHRIAPLSPVFALILVAVVSVAWLRRMERHNVRPRPAPAVARDSDAMIREAIANGQLLMSTSPCNESNDHSPMADGN
jgi:hypothetical protein